MITTVTCECGHVWSGRSWQGFDWTETILNKRCPGCGDGNGISRAKARFLEHHDEITARDLIAAAGASGENPGRLLSWSVMERSAASPVVVVAMKVLRSDFDGTLIFTVDRHQRTVHNLGVVEFERFKRQSRWNVLWDRLKVHGIFTDLALSIALNEPAPADWQAWVAMISSAKPDGVG